MAAEWFSVEVQTASGFFTGVYGLWNIYVTVVLWLYAPSHKVYQGSQEGRLFWHSQLEIDLCCLDKSED